MCITRMAACTTADGICATRCGVTTMITEGRNTRLFGKLRSDRREDGFRGGSCWGQDSTLGRDMIMRPGRAKSQDQPSRWHIRGLHSEAAINGVLRLSSVAGNRALAGLILCIYRYSYSSFIRSPRGHPRVGPRQAMVGSTDEKALAARYLSVRLRILE